MPIRPYFFHHCEPKARFDIQRLMSAFETDEQATEYSRARVDKLRQGGRKSRRLAARLAACGKGGAWCPSPACPTCARAHRRWLLGELLRLLARVPDAELRFTTVIMPERRVAKGRLNKFNPEAALAALKRQLERTNLPGLVLVGGLDLGLEVDRLNGNADAWQPHVHLIHNGGDELGKALRRHYPATDEVARPVQTKKVKDRAEQLSYCCKSVY